MVSVHGNADFTDVALTMADYNLTPVAVVDAAGNTDRARCSADDVIEALGRRTGATGRSEHRSMRSMSEREPKRKDSAHEATSAGSMTCNRATSRGVRHHSRQRCNAAPHVAGRLLTLAAIIGPGLIVMVGDQTTRGVSTYARPARTSAIRCSGRCPTHPGPDLNQEMVVRLGAVTGVGYARLIQRAVRRFWAGIDGGIFLLTS